MTKTNFLAKLEYFDMVHGVTVRAIGTLSDNDLEFRPALTVRTAKELIFHIYSQEKIIAEAVQQGSFTAEAAARSSPEVESVAQEVKTHFPRSRMFRHTRIAVIELRRKSCVGCQKKIFCVQSNPRSGRILSGDTLTLLTTSIGITVDSFTRTCGCSGKSRRCCMTMSDRN